MTDSKISLDPKLAGILSHITLFGWAIAYISRQEKGGKLDFFLRQTLGLHLISLALYLLPTWIFWGGFLKLILGFFLLATWIISLFGSLSDEERRIPLLGDFFQVQFRNI